MSRNWIFVRGLVRETAHWYDFPQHFRQKFPADKIEFLDLPGNGVFFQEKSPLAVSAYTDFLRTRSQTLKAGNKASLFCLSLGAMMGLDWMLRYPQEIELGIMVNLSSQTTSHFYQRLQPTALRHILPALQKRTPQEREAEVLKISCNLRTDLSEMAQEFAKVAATRPVSLENFARQLLAASRFKIPCQGPSQNLLFMRSMGDKLVSPACTYGIAELWKSPLVSHPVAGHDLAVDDPEWTLAQVADFLISGGRK